MVLAAVETGGTKVFCAVAERDNPHELVDTVRIPTRGPEETISHINAFLRKHDEMSGVDAVGVATFGPVDTDPQSSRYGWVLQSPKPGWQNVDLHACLDGLGAAPSAFITDVSGSLLGEHALGSARGMNNACYATIGTGVGVGILVEGRLISGHGTPELGHVPVRRHPHDDFPGLCVYHGDCLEGLASGPAVLASWGHPAQGQDIDIIGYYIAQLVVVGVLAVAPQRLVLGGGVSKTPGLIENVRAHAAQLLAGYLGADHPAQDPASGFVTPPALGDFAGIHGALELAQSLLD